MSAPEPPDDPAPADPPSGPAGASPKGPGAAGYSLEGTAAVTLAVFIDRPHLRNQVCEDAVTAGYRIAEAATLEAFAGQGRAAAAAVVLIDVPVPSPAALAALARQDMATRAHGTQLIVATSLAALEEVFACLDQSQPQLLVDPTSADVALALGRAQALSGRGEVRELAADDRRLLLRLAEEVSRLATRLDRLEQDRGRERTDRGDRLEAPALAFRGDEEALILPGARHPGGPGTGLPDAGRVRRVLRHRQQRAAYLGADLFADPAWDMLLDLTAARVERKQVSVTSLCIAAGVPATTALRWIAQMTEAGLFERIEDKADRRRAFIGLTDKAVSGMAAYFAAMGDLPV